MHQYRGLAVLLFNCAAEQPDFTHAWFPQSAFAEARVEGEVALARGGDGLVMLKSESSFELVGSGPTAGNELRVPGHRTAWIVRLGRHLEERSLDAFAARFAGLAIEHGDNDDLRVADPEYGNVVFHADGRIEAEGRVVDPSDWQIAGKATRFAPGPAILNS
jgi:hypothetical protein